MNTRGPETIKEAWEAYRSIILAKVDDADLGPHRDAFYAGCGSMWAMTGRVLEMGQAGQIRRARVLTDGLVEELQEFMKETESRGLPMVNTEAQPTMASVWLPIAKLIDPYKTDLLLCAPELVDLDCNPHGVAPGYWQDGSDDDGPYWEFGDLDHSRMRVQGTWIAAGYCMQHDHWVDRVCRPTHYMIIEGPV